METIKITIKHQDKKTEDKISKMLKERNVTMDNLAVTDKSVTFDVPSAKAHSIMRAINEISVGAADIGVK